MPSSAFGDGAASPVADGAFDLDAVELQLAEGVVDEGAAGARHDAAALERGAEPVADLGLAVGPVEAVEADLAGDAVAVDDLGRVALVVRELAAGAGHELFGVFEREVFGHPRQPLAEVFGVALDEGVRLGRVALFGQPQEQLVVDAVDEHGRQFPRTVWVSG